MTNVLQWAINAWHAYERDLDVKLLWPICKKLAKGDMVAARAAFYLHTLGDPAWKCLSETDVNAKIEALQ